jgi:dipeptidyl aminopeptidase/acylaminoacyl peptidase
MRRVIAFLLLVYPLLADKRPLTHDDYDSWKHIQNQVLSNDGHYLAYAIFPQQGDGELVVRDLKTGKETRQPIGELPPPPPPNYANPLTEDAPPPPPGLSLRFSDDNATLIALTFPRHADTEAAKRAKRKAEDMPKGDLLVIKLASGDVFRAPSVKNFQLPTKSSDFVAYLQVLKSETPKPANADQETPAAPKKKKIETGDLILRSLSDATERKFPLVSEYTLTNDGSLLVYAANGVFSLALGGKSEPVALLSGPGKYEKLAWDEGQIRLCFLSDRDSAASPSPEYKLYTWDRHAGSATEIVSTKTTGFTPKFVISETASISIAKGGSLIFFGTAPAPPAAKPPSNLPADERVSVDLWSWKDDFIQPMQKVRATADRTRSYRASFDLTNKKFVQLAGLEMQEAVPSEDGRHAIGNDDRAYRREQEYDERYEDIYVVNTTTGARTLAVSKNNGRVTWSPDSSKAIFYNGKDWVTISAADASLTNLTSKLKVSFGREEFDSPTIPPAYGLAGWTKDGRYALVYDRFDIWRLAADGSSSEKLTDGRPDHLAFRLVRFTHGEPGDRWIDSSKPLLLRAEDDETHDTGFYRASLEGNHKPQKLIFEAKNFANPIKARDAEVYVTSASTFSEFPDLLVTNASFHSLEKVTNANPQMETIAWGTAELIHYRNSDGLPLLATLYKPANFDPKKKYPMLVYIYERLTQNVHNFVEPRPTNVISPSYYASNGYLVLEPDIAYKIGYPGPSALGCVLPAVQEVVDRGFVDEKAIGIQGHSWGGYQIAYMVTQTNRFRAAAPGAPVADMISAYDGIRWGPGIPRQFQYEKTQSRIGGSLWQYPMRYIENSPIFMVDRVKTPLLMIHNDSDDAVPWYQGIEFYLALRRLNKEVYLFSYNGEPHNLRRRPNQKDYTVRLQQWFDHYLKGAPRPAWMDTGIPYLEKQGVTVTDSPEQ